MRKKVLLSLSFAFVGATFGFANLDSEMEDFYGCVSSSACGLPVVLCGETLNDLLIMQGDWEEILGCAEEGNPVPN